MITTNDNRTFNLDRIGANNVGKTHDDWVISSSIWNNDHREISRAQQILKLAEETNDCLRVFMNKVDTTISQALQGVENPKLYLPKTSRIVSEVAPKGFEGTVKAMKGKKEITNPYALAHWMKSQGYQSHKTASGKDKK